MSTFDFDRFNPEKTVCFTGHRSIPDDQRSLVNSTVANVIVRLADEGYTDFVFGGAVGFDTMAARNTENLRSLSAYSHIKVHIFMPCRSIPKLTDENTARIYHSTLKMADTVTYISDSYFQGAMHKRNRAMVDVSSCVVSYCTSDKGGTAYTVKYAEKHNRRVISVADIMAGADLEKSE